MGWKTNRFSVNPLIILANCFNRNAQDASKIYIEMKKLRIIMKKNKIGVLSTENTQH
jgi:hypothetical protein